MFSPVGLDQLCVAIVWLLFLHYLTIDSCVLIRLTWLYMTITGITIIVAKWHCTILAWCINQSQGYANIGQWFLPGYYRLQIPLRPFGQSETLRDWETSDQNKTKTKDCWIHNKTKITKKWSQDGLENFMYRSLSYFCGHQLWCSSRKLSCSELITN